MEHPNPTGSAAGRKTESAAVYNFRNQQEIWIQQSIDACEAVIANKGVCVSGFKYSEKGLARITQQRTHWIAKLERLRQGIDDPEPPRPKVVSIDPETLS